MLPKISTFSLITVAVLVATIVIVPNLLYRSDMDSLERVADLQIEDRQNLSQEMLDLTHASQYNLTNDYTYWDDMIAFADGKLDDAWGRENLDAGIVSFHVHGIWVIDRAGRVRYGVERVGGTDETRRNDVLPIPLELVKKAVEQEPLSEFHLSIDGTVYSVMTAGLVPTDDINRETDAQGYFLTLNAMDEDYLADLGEWTGTNISILPGSTPPDPAGLISPETGTFTFWLPLTDHTGTPVAQLRFTRSAEAISVIHSQARSERATNFVMFAGIAVLVFVVLALNTRARERAEELAAQITQELRKTNASLEQRVAERTADLEEDIARRSEAEERLKKRTEELERLNKVMVDRELRVVELKRQVKESGTPE